MPAFATPGPIAATVQVAGAQVRVRASERTDTVVLVEPVDPASAFDVKVAGRTMVSFTGGRLSVKTTVSGHRDGSVAVTIDLPAGSSLVVYLSRSRVHAEGALGECELHMARGQVQLDRVGALQANIAGGEVTIGRISGRADIHGSAAAVRISEAAGNVALSSSSGPTWIGHAFADVDLLSGSGRVDIDRADGSVTAATDAGAIRLGRMTRGHAKLSNHTDDIEIGVDEGTAARVDADSTRGSVRNSVPPRDPAPSGDTLRIHARTRHGDIIVRRAADPDRHDVAPSPEPAGPGHEASVSDTS